MHAANGKRAQRSALLDKIEALKRIEGALLGSIVENVGPFSQWPMHNVEQMLSSHLTYQPRINLTLFMLGNQCPPDLYAEWIISRNMLKDKPARTHVATLIKEHKAGELSRFKTYLLPFRVTAPPKPMADRKHFWDGVGDPMPKDAPPSAFVFAVETPGPIFMSLEGWRWDKAYGMLMNDKVGALAMSCSMPTITIEPISDPDLDDENGSVLTDVYGLPIDAYMADQMDMQLAIHHEASAVIKRPEPPTTITGAVKKARPVCGISQLF
jgi:hypothetical protein